MPKIEIYYKDTCPFCARAMALLESKQVEFIKIDLLAYPEKRDEMIKRTNGKTSVPEIFIDDQLIGGCDDLFALENENKLDALLK